MNKRWIIQWSLISFIWALLEAIWFFIIVDVIISLAVMRFGTVRAFIPAITALLGAMLGGIILYYWSAKTPQIVENLLLTVPGISQALLNEASINMASEPLQTLVFGGFTGIPFKIFAAKAQEIGLTPLSAFLEPAFIARLSRFAAILIASSILRIILYRKLRRVGLIRLTIFIWTLFYAWFGYVFWNII